MNAETAGRLYIDRAQKQLHSALTFISEDRPTSAICDIQTAVTSLLEAVVALAQQAERGN